MPRLFAALVRHGIYEQPADVPSAHLPYPLTDEGRAQATALGRELQQLADAHNAALVPLLDASSLLRAYETAQLASDELAAGLGRAFSVETFDALAERGLGAMANLTTAQIEALITRDPRHAPLPPKWKSDSHVRLPVIGAESLLEAGARVARHVRKRMVDLSEHAAGDSLKVFVAHGGAIRHAAVDLGVLPLPEVRGLSMYHCRPILLSYDAHEGFRHVDGEWKVRSAGAPPD